MVDCVDWNVVDTLAASWIETGENLEEDTTITTNTRRQKQWNNLTLTCTSAC